MKRDWKLAESPWELLSMKMMLLMMLSLYFIQDTWSLCMQIGATPAPEVAVVLRKEKITIGKKCECSVHRS